MDGLVLVFYCYPMANNNECPICCKRFTQHAPTLLCSTCNSDVHISCLPTYSNEDILAINQNINHWTCTKCLSLIFPFYIIEDNCELINTFQNANLPALLDLENMLFDPFDNTQDGGALDDLDPDDVFFNQQINYNNTTCKYRYPDQLANDVSKWSPTPNISILHQNIRSIRQNYTGFTSLLNSIYHSFSVLGLTKTWLKSYNAPLYSIEGYAHEFLTREGRPGGGVSMYINSHITYKTRADLNHQDDDVEMLWIEVERSSFNTPKNYIIGTIYRRPGSNITKFNELLADKLLTISLENKSILYMGDLNIDLLKTDTHSPTSDFNKINILYSLL